MRSIMQDIRSEFRRFIDGRTENLLIVPCEPDHSALLFKALEALEDDPESPDIFLTFGHPFTDPGQYVRESLRSSVCNLPASIRNWLSVVSLRFRLRRLS